MAGVTLKLDRRFYRQARGLFGKYTFDVGIVENGPHRAAKSRAYGQKSLAGGPARKMSRTVDGTLAGISESARFQTGVDFYRRPFRLKNNRDILRFLRSFFDLCAGRGQRRRAENALQAVVRNPIVRGDYGRNTSKTARAKGFNRLLIDTGQLFRAIKAKVRVKGGGRV